MSHHGPLFSIIVPVYNTEKYLDQCVQSILDQTFTDFELILVVKDSGDNCVKMCDEYARKDSRVKSIRQQGSGIVSARKQGILLACGEYAVPIESDDWISTDYLSSAVEIIRLNHPDIVCCGAVSVTSKATKDIPITVNSVFYKKNEIEKHIFPILIEDKNGRGFPSDLLGKFIVRNLYSKYQLAVNDSIVFGESFACMKPCIFEASSVFLMKQCLYYKRRNMSATTRADYVSSLSVPQLLGQHYEKYIENIDGRYNFQPQIYRAVIRGLMGACVRQFNHEDSWKEITRDISKALDDPYYQNALSHCKWKGYWRGTLALYALKKRCFILMWLFNSYRNFKFSRLCQD